MAWRTAGETNEDMCTKMFELNVIPDSTLLNVFKSVDRGYFAYGNDYLGSR